MTVSADLFWRAGKRNLTIKKITNKTAKTAKKGKKRLREDFLARGVEMVAVELEGGALVSGGGVGSGVGVDGSSATRRGGKGEVKSDV